MHKMVKEYLEELSEKELKLKEEARRLKENEKREVPFRPMYNSKVFVLPICFQGKTGYITARTIKFYRRQ